MMFFKEKIQEEIKANDKAMEIYIESNDRISKVIYLLQTPSDLSEDMAEMRGLL